MTNVTQMGLHWQSRPTSLPVRARGTQRGGEQRVKEPEVKSRVSRGVEKAQTPLAVIGADQQNVNLLSTACHSFAGLFGLSTCQIY